MRPILSQLSETVLYEAQESMRKRLDTVQYESKNSQEQLKELRVQVSAMS